MPCRVRSPWGAMCDTLNASAGDAAASAPRPAHGPAVDPIALIGGLRLGGPAFEPVIAPTVAALTTMGPELIAPGHCTGWRANTLSPPPSPTPGHPTAAAPPTF